MMVSEPAKPTRVGMLITELEVGGAEQRFCDIACGLERSQFEVKVCSLGPRPKAPKDGLAARLESEGIPVRYLDCRSSLQFTSAAQRVRQWLLDEEIEVLQSFLFHANVVAAWSAPASVRLSLGIRVADPRRWRTWLERRAARRAQRVVCVSEQVRQFVAARGFPEAKLAVIDNGIDLRPVTPLPRETLHADDNAPLVVFVGRLDPQKGIDWLLANVDRWLDESPACQFRLIGDGPLRSSLDSLLAKQTHGQAATQLLGWSPQGRAAIAAADLLVLPSRWEGMPNVVMEAMAEGKPVLCANAEGVQQLLGEAARQQTAEFGDIDDWTRKTAALLGDPDLRRQLGAANQARISQCFSRSRMVAEFQRLFSTLSETT